MPQYAIPRHFSVWVDGQQSNSFYYPMLVLVGVNPWIAEPGENVRPNGYGFGTERGDGYVRFGQLAASIESWSDRQIYVTVPQQAYSDTIVLGVKGEELSLTGFKVARPFTITSVEPDSGFYGDDVTIRGNGFGHLQVNDAVTFRHGYVNRAAAQVTEWTDTMIIVRVPHGARSGELRVTIGDYSASGGPFTVFGFDEITTPLWGPAGHRVVIEGGDFGDTQGDNMIMFGDVPGVIREWHYNEIITEMPYGVFNGQMKFIFGGIVGLSKEFKVVRIDEITPTWVTWGDEMKFRGINLKHQGPGPDPQLRTEIGGVRSPPSLLLDTVIIDSVPSGARSGIARLFIHSYTFPEVPIVVFQIESVTPFLGEPGDTVRLKGTGFGDYDAVCSVHFGDVDVEPNYWKDTLVVAVIPEGATGDSVYLSIGEINCSAVPLAVYDYPEIFDLLSATNRRDATFEGDVEFTNRTECIDILDTREHIAWYLDQQTGQLDFDGRISADGNEVDSMRFLLHYGRSEDWPGIPPEFEEYYYEMYFVDVPLHHVDWEDTIVVYQLSGPEVQDHVHSVTMWYYSTVGDGNRGTGNMLTRTGTARPARRPLPSPSQKTSAAFVD
jgi:hypothetical protein